MATGYDSTGMAEGLAACVLNIEAGIERLVRFADDNHVSRCHLLMDPTLRDGRTTLQACLQTFGDGDFPVVPVRVAPGKLDKTHWPLLVEIDLASLAGREVLATSVAMAYEDWQHVSLRIGNGHRIGGWIFSDEQPTRLSAHLASRFVQLRVAGKQTLVRFHDPSVFDQAWDICTASQRNALLGTLYGWCTLQRDGGLIVYQREQHRDKNVSPFPRFTPQQWKRLDHIGAINRACAKLPVQPALATVRQVAEALLRADGYGFQNSDDLVEFAWRALTVSPQFDTHARVQQCLRMRNPGDTFGYVTAGLTDTEWSAIAVESKKELIR